MSYMCSPDRYDVTCLHCSTRLPLKMVVPKTLQTIQIKLKKKKNSTNPCFEEILFDEIWIVYHSETTKNYIVFLVGNKLNFVSPFCLMHIKSTNQQLITFRGSENCKLLQLNTLMQVPSNGCYKDIKKQLFLS